MKIDPSKYVDVIRKVGLLTQIVIFIKSVQNQNVSLVNELSMKYNL